MDFLNNTYVKNNTLPQERIEENHIELIADDEIFVAHPVWPDYYVSQHGRVISTKENKCRLLAMTLGGAPGSQYIYYKFCTPSSKPVTISAQRAVADVFLPNFWQDRNVNRLQAHHMDRDKLNNSLKNIMLLPTYLHVVMNRVQKTACLIDGEFKDMSVYEIMEHTGLSITAIISSFKDIPARTTSDYSVYEIGRYQIAVTYYPRRNRRFV